MRKLATLLLTLLVAPTLALASSGSGPSLPATCVVGDIFSSDGPPPQDFYCIGTNTWKPQGPGRILAIRKGVNLNSVGDNALTMPIGRYYAKQILITGASTSLATTAARIGIWTGAGATGTNIVTAASSQTVLQALTTTATVMEGPVGVQVTSSLSQVFLRVTVAHGSAATVDVYVMGDLLP